MANLMKAHFFQVHNLLPNERLDGLLQSLGALELEQRLKFIFQNEMRLEEIAAPNSRGNPTPYWLLDFTKLRFENGPGKASRSDPIEGFDLDVNEGFGEETAAIYDPATRHMTIQYNHHGPRSGAIQDYLSTFTTVEGSAFQLQVRLTDDAEARLAQKQIVKKLHFKIAPPRITGAMRRAGVSIERTMALSENVNGQTIEVIISAGKGQLASGPTHQWIATLMRVMHLDTQGTEPVVETLKVHAKEGLEAETDVINLLSSKAEQEIDGLVLGADRRYTRRSRWDALLRARNGWAI